MAFTDYNDGVSFTGLSADTAAFYLLGGQYGIGLNATWGGGSVTFQTLMPDGTTYITAATAFTADGTAVVNVPPGTYKFDIVTATAVQGFVSRIPKRIS